MGYGEGFDDDADDDFVGAPPPMTDREWRHPAELAMLARQRRTQRNRRVAGLVLGSAVGGGLIFASPWYSSDDVDTMPVAQLSVVDDTDDVPRSAASWASDISASARTSTVVIQSEIGTRAIAAGVAINDHGHVITSSGALGDATTFVVHTDSGEVHRASLVGHDASTDIAVLELDATIPVAPIASGPIGEGDAVAVLDASGHAHADTVAHDAVVATSKGGEPLVGLLSLTNSRDDVVAGGPVVDASGTVIGIAAHTDAGEPTAAVPIEIATRVADQLIEDGSVTPAWLGVQVLDLDGRIVVDAVEAGGPATTVGVRAGDHIVAVDGEWVDDTTELIARLRGHEPAETIAISIVRDGQRTELRIELGAAPTG